MKIPNTISIKISITIKNHTKRGSTKFLKSEKKYKNTIKLILINCKKFEDVGINGDEKEKNRNKQAENEKEREIARHGAKNVWQVPKFPSSQVPKFQSS